MSVRKPDVVKNAEERVNSEGGFPAQQQEPPGSTTAMDPVPDHGESSYEGHGKLEGMVALITGGDSGIGRAVAIAYAREGADVALSYMPEEQDDAEDTAGWVEKAGRRVLLLPGDLREEKYARSLPQRTVDELGGLDVVVNNAAFQYARDEEFEQVATDRIDRTFTTNLTAMFWITQESLPHLGERSSIINTSSIQAFEPSDTLIDYAATKAAINNFTVNMAAHLGERGIRVNAVCPGPIWTPLQPATQEAEKLEQFGGDTPLGRAGQPAECAPAYVFLASPADASYVSGTVLGVTGGKPIF
ncbi:MULTISPECIES: SDR family oxidoreductase [Barrientosiimonas]|uniref:Dehydrogenase n=1 Tax=Barrientosiimonas endolithica TaxID=1535208 RepID=A0ABM8HF70_9MICO|nr:SDR family oxidoreductase [Barrientosiimonas endolithica]BDZ59587.1 dehydrogenase [Barrientosiimonas endolithica]